MKQTNTYKYEKKLRDENKKSFVGEYATNQRHIIVDSKNRRFSNKETKKSYLKVDGEIEKENGITKEVKKYNYLYEQINEGHFYQYNYIDKTGNYKSLSGNFYSAIMSYENNGSEGVFQDITTGFAFLYSETSLNHLPAGNLIPSYYIDGSTLTIEGIKESASGESKYKAVIQLSFDETMNIVCIYSDSYNTPYNKTDKILATEIKISRYSGSLPSKLYL